MLELKNMAWLVQHEGLICCLFASQSCPEWQGGTGWCCPFWRLFLIAELAGLRFPWWMTNPPLASCSSFTWETFSWATNRMWRKTKKRILVEAVQFIVHRCTQYLAIRYRVWKSCAGKSFYRWDWPMKFTAEIISWVASARVILSEHMWIIRSHCVLNSQKNRSFWLCVTLNIGSSCIFSKPEINSQIITNLAPAQCFDFKS